MAERSLEEPGRGEDGQPVVWSGEWAELGRGKAHSLTVTEGTMKRSSSVNSMSAVLVSGVLVASDMLWRRGGRWVRDA